MFPDAANEASLDPCEMVNEATLLGLSGMTPGKWELRDASSDDGFPADWGPSFFSTHYRVAYELVVRTLDVSAEEEGHAAQHLFDARVPVWLSSNPATLAAALADASADAPASTTGNSKEVLLPSAAQPPAAPL